MALFLVRVSRILPKESERTYIQAQHLENALTMKSLKEFKDQYIDEKATLILEEGLRTRALAPAQEDTTTLSYFSKQAQDSTS